MTTTPPVYIISGGAGFIGSNLVARLQRDEPEARLYVVDDFSTGSYANIVEACIRHNAGPFRGTIMPDSITDLNWQPAIMGLKPKAVFHLAAITNTLEFDEKKMISVNSEPFIDILDACIESEVPLVYASSGATYGTPPQAEQEIPFPIDAAGNPSNVYGFSKWLMDVEVQRVFQQSLIDSGKLPHVVGLRYFNVFGPGEARKGKMASMIYHLANQMLAGNNPKIFEHGQHQRDQIFVDDIVSGTIAASKASAKPGIYNLGSGTTTTFNDIVDGINTALGTSKQPEYIPMPEEMITSYQHYTCADITKTTEGLGWAPEHTPSEAIISYAAQLAKDSQKATAHPS
ncbi:MAG: NAD-dependent epimerase/dehydratase family protein [Phycisphaerales bacterium]|nr:NAD-dependent epimerase/dehydratase family protein [Phycisphaerales bacterium]